MDLFIQIALLVVIVYLTLMVSVKTMFGDYTNLFAIMVTILLTCMVYLTIVTDSTIKSTKKPLAGLFGNPRRGLGCCEFETNACAGI